MHRRPLLALVATLLAVGVPAPARAQPADTTTLVVLGVEHSGQLVGREYHPGYLRAFFERVRPAALCIERSPGEFARGDHCEFTYEIQHVAVPWARRAGTALCPIDWLPSRDDERLAFGLPTVAEADARLEPHDLAAILSFNLLGVQPL